MSDVYSFMEVEKTNVAKVLLVTGKKYKKRVIVVEQAGRAKGTIAKSDSAKKKTRDYSKKTVTGAKKTSKRGESAKEHFTKRRLGDKSPRKTTNRGKIGKPKGK